MRILITGTAGFVGSHVLESVLRMTNWDVVCIDSLQAWHNGNVQSTIQAMADLRKEGRGVSHMTHDLSVPFREQQLDFIGDVDYIANIASMSQVEASIKDPVGFVGNNIQLVLNMLELARDKKPRRFIHMSTDEVYGRVAPCSPTDYQPSSPYAASKASQEAISLSYWHTYKVPVSIVNSANMFGQRQSRLAFIPKVVRWINDGVRIPVHYHGDFPGARHYTYVKNVTDHIVELLRVDSLDASAYRFPTRIPLPGQERVDNKRLVNLIGEIMGREPWIIKQSGESARPGWDPVYETLAENPDWRQSFTFEQGLEQTVKWLVEQL